jgi:hypothetical protein
MKQRVGPWSTALVGVWLVACGGNKAAQSGAGAVELGRTPEAPVVTCGPDQSYDYVARTFRCPDGSNPLGGDRAAAKKARQGSMPAPQGDHILDAYEVPCPGKPVTVYVDLYGCPEYVARLHESEKGTAEGDALLRSFQQGDLEGVLERCQSLGPTAPDDEQAWCVALVPASLYGQGHERAALAALGDHCSRLPPASANSDARAAQLALTVVALAQLAQSGKLQASEAERNAIVESWLESCNVPEEQLTKTLDAMQRE